MNHRQLSERELEDLLSEVLTQGPAVSVPEDFAHRVVQSLPAQRSRRSRSNHGGATAIAVAGAAAIAAFSLAFRATPSFASLAFDAECVCMLQAIAIVGWIMTRRADVA